MDHSFYPSSPQRTPSAQGASRAWRSPRSLHEPVLSSAQEELGVNPEPPSGSDTSASDASVEGDSRQPVWWGRSQAQLTRYVSEQPGRAALLALGAGALAALLLGRGLSRRRRRD